MKEWKCIRNYRVNPKAKHIVGRYWILCNNCPRTRSLFRVQHKIEVEQNRHNLSRERQNYCHSVIGTRMWVKLLLQRVMEWPLWEEEPNETIVCKRWSTGRFRWDYLYTERHNTKDFIEIQIPFIINLNSWPFYRNHLQTRANIEQNTILIISSLTLLRQI